MTVSHSSSTSTSTSTPASASSQVPVPASGDATSPAAAFEAWLAQQESSGLLRFITCGSVDDGKSTLIGRILYDARMLLDDQMEALERDSRKVGTQGGELDFALLLDGLQAEREQGITIDVAYRYFNTERRKFIVADTPGHEQYTRNMATGASTADLAVLLVDARRGILVQTHRHSYIVALMGIRQVVLAVNKMDLVDYRRERFEEIAEEYRAFAAQLGIRQVTCIPLSALRGDNVTTVSDRMDWYHGPALLPFLETVTVERASLDRPFCLPVQWVNRPNLDFRGYCGTVASGRIRPGDEVTVLPSRRSSRVARIVTMDGDLAEAVAGQAVTLVLEDELDASRGAVLTASPGSVNFADQFAAHVLWMDEHRLLPERQYLIRIGTATTSVQVTKLRHRINVNTFEQQAARTLDLNDVGFCNLRLDTPLPFQPFEDNRTLGSFILIDRLSHATVGAGVIAHELRRATNIAWQLTTVDKAARARMKGQKSCILWFTGLSGSGKSTIANLVEKRLHDLGRHTYMLDGDNLRHGLNKDLGFTDEDRVENIRRAAEAARLFVDAGMIVLVSLIAPFREERRMARGLVEAGEFIEVFVDTPLVECERRDPKGLYRKVRAGQIRNFTGVDSEYQAPEAAELVLATLDAPADVLANRVVDLLAARGFIPDDSGAGGDAGLFFGAGV